MIGIDFLISLAHIYGYPAVFLAGFLSSFTIFLPSPTFVVVFLFGHVLNPFLLGIFAGLGSAFGEFTGYIIGFGFGRLIKKKKKKINEIAKLFKKYHPGLVIFIFAATPLPFDLVGIFCGTINFDKKKFFIYTLLGKLVKFWLLAYAGFYGIQWILHYFRID